MDVAPSRTKSVIKSRNGWHSGRGRVMFKQFIDSILGGTTQGTSCIALIYQDDTPIIFYSEFDRSVEVPINWGRIQKGKHAGHFLCEYLN